MRVIGPEVSLSHARSTLLAFCVFACTYQTLNAQAKAAAAAVSDVGSSTASATTNDEGPAGIVPFVNGPNLSIGTSSQHDSSNGWSSLLTPNLAWRFNRHFAADVNATIYTYINVLVTGGTKAKPTYTPSTKRFIVGDTALNGHFDLARPWLNYNGTVTLGLPSGSDSDGLGAGQPTYNVNNHFEKSFSIFTPDLEVGIGDSSSLVGARIRKSYISVGTLAHFQAGTSIELPFRMSFEADAYEELPIAGQTLYSTTGKGKKKVTTATGTSVAEDNGFNNSLDLPLSRHVTLSGFYNRSLRARIDTAGFSLTFLLKAPPREAAH